MHGPRPSARRQDPRPSAMSLPLDRVADGPAPPKGGKTRKAGQHLCVCCHAHLGDAPQLFNLPAQCYEEALQHIQQTRPCRMATPTDGKRVYDCTTGQIVLQRIPGRSRICARCAPPTAAALGHGKVQSAPALRWQMTVLGSFSTLPPQGLLTSAMRAPSSRPLPAASLSRNPSPLALTLERPVHAAAPKPTRPPSSTRDKDPMFLMGFGNESDVLEQVLPPDRTAELLEGAFNRVWDAALKYGLKPMEHIGKVRDLEPLHTVAFTQPLAASIITTHPISIYQARDIGVAAKVKREHEKLARARLGWNGEGLPRCGALHGGWCAMGGGAEVQSVRFVNDDGAQRQACYLWSLERALQAYDPQMMQVLSILVYAQEHLMLRSDPELWLRCFSAFGDLNDPEPRPGRVFKSAMWNQYVINLNLLLGRHVDHRNSAKVPLLDS